MRKIFDLLRVMFVVAIFILELKSQQLLQLNTCKFVIAENGLYMRKKSSIKSDIILKIGFGNEVEIISEPKYSDGYNWCKVKYNDQLGFVAIEHLSEIELIQDDNGNKCNIWNKIVTYFNQETIKVDSLEYENNGEEGYHRYKEYYYENGLRIKHNTFYESFMDEIIIRESNFTRVQIVNVVKSAFKSCNKLSHENLSKIHKLNYLEKINYIEYFSSISIEKLNESYKVSLRGGP